jgi:hypothetical protein
MRVRIRFRIQLINLDADPDPNFYVMHMRIRMRIHVTKMMRIRIHNTAFPGIQFFLILHVLAACRRLHSSATGILSSCFSAWPASYRLVGLSGLCGPY